MKTEEIAPMALAQYNQVNGFFEQQVNDGTFIMPTQLQILEEEKYSRTSQYRYFRLG
ncbi:hypothetical protein OH492_11920 [Vibrio chagasii]|nr:hypothetical protein [Vibrio chagasii]